MTAKYYFRNLALHDLGFPADADAIELHNYLTERLSNLNQYTIPNSPDFIYFGKNTEEILIDYNTKNEYIDLHYMTFSEKLIDDFLPKYHEIDIIVLSYVVRILHIKADKILKHVV